MRLLGERKRKGRVGRRERYASRQGKHCSSSGREALGSIPRTRGKPQNPSLSLLLVATVRAPGLGATLLYFLSLSSCCFPIFCLCLSSVFLMWTLVRCPRTLSPQDPHLTSQGSLSNMIIVMGSRNLMWMYLFIISFVAPYLCIFIFICL